MKNNIISSNNFAFYKLNFYKSHFTDNTNGSPMNYIGYMLKGKAKIVSKNKTIEIFAGDVFFIPYNLPYKSYWYGSDEIILLSYGFITTEASEKINFDLQIADCDETVKDAILKIPTKGKNPTCETLGFFYNALSKLIPYLNEIQKRSKKQDIVDKAKKYISENINCTVFEIASHCYISEPYLYLCFQEKAGCSPNEYRLKIIAKKGTELLITTDKSVEEISSDLGLSSSSHFRKILKKFTEMTPREIRKTSSF